MYLYFVYVKCEYKQILAISYEILFVHLCSYLVQTKFCRNLRSSEIHRERGRRTADEMLPIVTKFNQ